LGLISPSLPVGLHQAQLRCSSSGFGAKKKKRHQRKSNLGLGAESQAPHHCAAPLFVLVGRRRHRRRGGAGGIVPPSALLATRRAYVDQRLSPRHQTRVRADGRSHLRISDRYATPRHATPRVVVPCKHGEHARRRPPGSSATCPTASRIARPRGASGFGFFPDTDGRRRRGRPGSRYRTRAAEEMGVPCFSGGLAKYEQNTCSH